MELTGINQLWVADITYVQLPNGFAYLAVILDAFSRKCLGWHLSRNIDAKLCLNALSMAFEERKGTSFAGLVHHSDQGVQYAAKEYVKALEENGIRVSMSRKGNPYDNAKAESFFKTFKVEEVYVSEYQSFKDALENIQRFIEVVYNKKRLHSSLGYKPPDDYEQQLLMEACA
jgi:transposase InsO family protein